MFFIWMFEKHDIKSRGIGFEYIVRIMQAVVKRQKILTFWVRVNNAFLHGRHVKKQTILCQVCRYL